MQHAYLLSYELLLFTEKRSSTTSKWNTAMNTALMPVLDAVSNISPLGTQYPAG